jgi:hypothetical protein
MIYKAIIYIKIEVSFMLAAAKSIIEKIRKYKVHIFYASGITAICINLVIIYFLIKLIFIRLGEIIPLVKIVLG